jgi:predicted DNA-binding transcriptional regulator AlpA
MTDTPDFEKAETYARYATKFYGSADLQALTGLPWAEIVALESRGEFPKRTAEVQGDAWRKSDVDAWLKDRKQ